MNDNQISQIKKLLRIEEQNSILRKKIQVLQATISSNEEKIERMKFFLKKQKIGNEEIENFVLGIEPKPNSEKTQSESQDTDSNKTAIFNKNEAEKTN